MWYSAHVKIDLSDHEKLVAERTGERLDRALQTALPEMSRTAIQRMVEEGLARVNGRREKSGYKLHRGDEVTWRVPDVIPAPDVLIPEAIPLSVTFEDEHLIVLDKPRGLVVHPAPGHSSGTLVNAVLAHAGEDLTGIGGVERPGIVHRLDKDTSGLMVVAKTETAYASLQAQIQSREMERRYLALVRGGPRWDRASIDAPIGRHPFDRKKMTVMATGSSHTHRDARTDLRVLERFPGFTLLEAKLHTGRTHQVRVHCAYIRLPVVGDETYGGKNTDRDSTLSSELRAALVALGGQALHAHRLTFRHPLSEERMQFMAPPPGDFQAVLKQLSVTWTAPLDDPWPED